MKKVFRDEMQEGQEQHQEQNHEHEGEQHNHEGEQPVATDAEFHDGLPFNAEEQPQHKVILKLKKGVSKKLLSAIISNNEDVSVDESEDAYTITAQFLKITRTDVENAIGTISNARWKMLFINREGEVKEFSSYLFSMGVPTQAVADEEAAREMVQFNVRIDKELKGEIDLFRSDKFANMTQNEFVAEACRELVNLFKKERIAN